jgi:hypothetical protein
MDYAIEMGSVATLYIRSFVQTGSGIQKLIRELHRQHGDHISHLLPYSK